MTATDTWILLSPVLMAVGAGVVALALDAMGRPREAAAGAALALAVAAALGFSLGWGYEPTLVLGAVRGDGTQSAGALLAGGWASNVAGVLLALAAIALAADASRLEREGGGPIAALVPLAAGSAALLATTRDIALFVIALETVALCSYAFVASAHSRRSDEAAMKYFVQGAVMTGLLLYGVAVLYGFFGMDFEYSSALSMSAATSGGVLFVLVTLASAISFKLSVFPFHWWAPDALECAPAAPAAVLASVPKVAVLVAAATLFGGVFGAHATAWGPLFALLAVASIAFGNFAALKQASYQRMLAYSGVAQGGYALAALVAMAGLIDQQGSVEFPARLFAVTYGLGVLGAFLVGQGVRDHDAGWDGSIAGLRGLASRKPALAFAAAVCLLSLTGIPLTAGFWGKFWVFYAAVVGDAAWLAVVGFVGSVVSFGYYGAVLRAMYFDDPLDVSREIEDAGSGEPLSGEGSGASTAAFVVALAVLAVGAAPVFWGFTPLQTFLGS